MRTSCAEERRAEKILNSKEAFGEERNAQMMKKNFKVVIKIQGLANLTLIIN